jgi:hypothetical protein
MLGAPRHRGTDTKPTVQPFCLTPQKDVGFYNLASRNSSEFLKKSSGAHHGSSVLASGLGLFVHARLRR